MAKGNEQEHDVDVGEYLPDIDLLRCSIANEKQFLCAFHFYIIVYIFYDFNIISPIWNSANVGVTMMFNS